MSSKKIVFVTGSMMRGGAERVISVISNYLAENGWDVTILQLLFSGCEYPLDPRIHVIDLSRSDRKQILDTPRLIFKTRSTVRRIRPDVVVSFMMTINILTSAALLGMRVPFVPSERNDPAVGRSSLEKKLVQWAYARSTLTIFQTKTARDYFPEKIRNKSVIIPNPVTVSTCAAQNNSRRIVSVGRLVRQKNQQLLIHAFAETAKTHPDYTLELYGRGNLEKELQDLIDTLGLNERVFLRGNVNNVHEQIADASLFVLSSNYEGLSNALIEAMMMGLPCISTDCTGADEIITDGQDGIIVPKNDEAAMAGAFCAMLDNRDEAQRMAHEARVSARNKFGSEHVCIQWQKALEEIICR